MGYSTLNFQHDGHGIATITLNVPEKRNAISSQMVSELLEAFRQAEKEPARVVVLTGQGKAFCAGMDLSELQELARETQEKNIEDARRLSKMLYRLYSFPKPVIAAVNGHAIAGGCMLATLADFTLAVPEAKFGYPEVKLGFIPAIVTTMLRRAVNERLAMELALTGEPVAAPRAHAIGLINGVFPDAEFEASVERYVAVMSEQSATAMSLSKRVLYQTDGMSFEESIEAGVQANVEARATEDFKRGVARFLKKSK